MRKNKLNQVVDADFPLSGSREKTGKNAGFYLSTLREL
jgi:hypothetical protein